MPEDIQKPDVDTATEEVKTSDADVTTDEGNNVEQQAPVTLDDSELETLLDDKPATTADDKSDDDGEDLKKKYYESSKEGVRLAKENTELKQYKDTVDVLNKILENNPELYDKIVDEKKKLDSTVAPSKQIDLTPSVATSQSQPQLADEDRQILDAIKQQQREAAKAKVKSFVEANQELAQNKELLKSVKETALGIATARGDKNKWIDYLEKAYRVENPDAIINRAKVEGAAAAQGVIDGQIPSAPSSAASKESPQLTADERKEAEKAVKKGWIKSVDAYVKAK